MYGQGHINTNLVLTPYVADSSFVIWLTNSGSLGDFNVASSIDLNVYAKSSDSAPVNYSIVSGSLPTGLILDSVTGAISGTAPSIIETINLTIRATNDFDKFSDQAFSLNFVNNAPIWQTPYGSVGTAQGGTNFSTTLLATDPKNLPISYSIFGGSLPPGITIDASTGLLSGILPVVSLNAVYTFTASASDGTYNSTQSFSIGVDFNQIQTWISASGSLGTDVQGKYFYALITSITYVPNATVTYAVTTGSLPAGLSLNSSSGVISGNLPNVEKDTLFPFIITASDGQTSLPRQFSITSIVDDTGVDSFANSVVFLMHMDELDNTAPTNQQNFVDILHHTPYSQNVVFNDRNVHLFGNASAYFNGNGDLKIPGVGDFDLSATDFTIEFDALPYQLSNLRPGSSEQRVPYISVGNNSVHGSGTIHDGGVSIYHDGVSNLVVAYSNLTGVLKTALFPTNIAFGAWTRIAIVRSGSTLQAFVDGQSLGTVNASDGLTLFNQNVVALGSNPPDNNLFLYNGLLDEVRITKAVRYTASYVLPTRPYPNIPAFVSTSLTDAISQVNYNTSVVATQADNHSLLYSATGLPTGLNIDLNGNISGTAPQALSNTVYSPIFTVYDTYNSVSRLIDIVDRIRLDPYWVSASGSLGTFVENTTVSVSLSAKSPQSLPLTFSVQSGELPTGLNISGSKIVGHAPVESANAVFDFVLAVTDGFASINRSFSITIDQNQPPTWVSAGNIITEPQTYSVNFQLVATDPLSQNLTYTIVSGSLPSTIVLDASGVLFGTMPNVLTDTTYSFVVRASNGGLYADQSLSIVSQYGLLPTWFTNAGSLGEFLAVSNAVQIVLSGNSNIANVSPTFSIVSGSLPAGLILTNLNGTATISGYASAIANSTNYNFTAEITNGIHAVDRNFSILIDANHNIVWDTTSNLGSYNAGSNVAIVLMARTFDTETLSYNFVSGTLPTGLTLNSNEIIGNVAPVLALSSPLDYGFVLSASNLVNSVSRTFSLSVISSNPVWVTPSGPIGLIYNGTPYSKTFMATSTAPLSYTVSTGTLPSGLTLDVSGNLTGTTTIDGSYAFSITASDGINSTSQSFTSIVAEPGTPTWITPSNGLTPATADIGYSFQLSATDPNNLPLTYTLQSGSLPAGLTLSAAGSIYGSPSPVVNTITDNFVLTVSNGNESISQNFSLTVNKNDSLTWITPSGTILTGIATTSGSYVLQYANTSVHPVTLSITSGTFPNTLTLANTGVISGLLPSVSTNKSYSFTVTANNTIVSTSRNFVIVDNAATPVWTTVGGSLGSGYASQFFRANIAATDPLNVNDLNFAITIGTLPTGLTLVNNGDNTATISGYLPDVSRNITTPFTISVSNPTASTSRAFSITDLYNSFQWTIPAGLIGVVIENTPYTFTGIQTSLAASYTISSGSLPSGISLASNGTLSGTLPASASSSTYNFEVTAVSNSGSFPVLTRVFSLIVNPLSSLRSADTYSNFVVLEMHLNEPTATSFDVMRHTVVSLSGNYYATNRAVFGNANSAENSYFLSGGGGLRVPDAQEFDFSSSDFTVEFWQNFKSIPGNLTTSTFFSCKYFNVSYSNSNLIVKIAGASYNFPFVANTLWNNIAVVNSAGSLSVYVNGVQIGTSVSIGGLSVISTSSSSYLMVGSLMTSSASQINGVVGFMTEFRLTRAARYTSNYSISFVPNPNLPIITAPTALPFNYGGRSYSQQFSGTDPYSLGVSYSIASGSLPSGLTLSSSGLLSGTSVNPSQDTTYNFKVSISDGLNTTTTFANYALVVKYYVPVAWVTSSGSLGSATSGYNFNATVTASGSLSITNYSIYSGALPSTLRLNAATGQITGTLSVVLSDTVYNFAITATDGVTSAIQNFQITSLANDPPVWNTSSGSLGNASPGVFFTSTISATDPQSETVTYGIKSGGLPAGLTLNSATGVISGTPTNPSAEKVQNFMISASNGFTSSTLALSILSLYIAPPYFVVPSVLNIIAATNFSYQINVTDPQNLPLTVTAASLPTGVSVSPSGVLSGSLPALTGNNTLQIYRITLSATNGTTTATTALYLGARQAQTPIFTSPPAGSIGTYANGPITNTILVAHDITSPVSDISYSLASGSLPAGISLLSNGLIYGNLSNVTTTQTFAFTVSASNGILSNSRSFTITEEAVNLAPTWVTVSGSLPNTVASQTYNYQLIANPNNNNPVTYSLSSSTLPSGLSLLSNGVISGNASNPTTNTTTNFIVSAYNGVASTNEAFSITVNALFAPAWTGYMSSHSVLSNSGTELGGAFEETFYNGMTLPADLTVAKYIVDPQGLPIIFSTGSALPSGVVFNSNGAFTGTIGNNITTGTAPVVINASNGYLTATQTWTLYLTYVAAPTWNTISGTISTISGGSIYSYTLRATDSQGLPLTYLVTSGSLPPGLSLSTDGIIFGTASNPGSTTNYNFVVTASNGTQSTPNSFVINVRANGNLPVWVTPSGSLGSFIDNTTITSIQLVANSISNAALTYSVSRGSLPTGISLNGSGLIFGTTPVVLANTVYNFVTVAAETANAASFATQSFSIAVNAPSGEPVFNTASGSLGSTLGGKPFSYMISATDPNNYTISYSVSSGSLPANLVLDANTAVISGTTINPTANTTYNFTISANDGVAAIATRDFSIAVDNNAPPVFHNSGLLANVYGFSVVDVFANAVDTNNQALTFGIVSGSLPSGLSLNASSGEITGTANNIGATSNFVVYATNQVSTANSSYSIIVDQYLAPTWNGLSGNIGEYLTNTAFNYTFVATDPQNGALTYSVVGGTLPSGLVLNGATGALAGTLPLIANTQTYNFTVDANNAHLSTGLACQLTVVANEYPVWQTANGSIGSVYGGSTFTANVVATDPINNALNISYSIVSGSLPNGITLSSVGVISGNAQNPVSNTTTSFTIAASNGFYMTNRTFSITVNYTAPPVWNTSANLGTLYGGNTVSIPLSATDPRGLTVTYFADPNNAANHYTLPAGLIFNAANATIYGTLVNPNANTSFNFTVDATNSVSSNALTFFANVVEVFAPSWQTSNGSLGSAFGLTTVAAVPLEMNFEGNSIIDNQGHSVTTIGNAALSNATSINGFTSLYLGGNTNLDIAQNNYEFELRKDDFTIEISVNFSSLSTTGNYKNTIIQQWAIGNLGWGLSYFGDSSTTPGLQFYYSTDGTTSNYIGTTFEPTLNTWYRIAVVRTGSTLAFFVNGLLLQNSSLTASIYPSTASISIGYDAPSNSSYFTGYIDELRLTIGLGRYAANYTPSLLPFYSSNIETLFAVDSNNLPITYSVNGTLPPGITLIANSGAFSGSFGNVANATTYPFSVTASNGYLTNVASFTITVTPEKAPVWVTNAGSIGNVLGGYAFTGNVSAVDVNYPHVLYALANGALPSGFALNATTGSISGLTTNPTNNTTSNFVVTASDGYLTNSLNVAITVVENLAPVINLAANSVIGPWYAGVANTVTITATDPTGYNQTINFSASLPTGLTISNSGVISGTIFANTNANANVAATITATNGIISNTVPFFVGEKTTPAPNWISPPAGSLGNIVENYAIAPTTLLASDPNNLSLSYTIQSGALPNGLILNSTSGVISGTPSESQVYGANTYSFVAAVSNGFVSNTRNYSYLVTANAPPVWLTASLPTGFSTEVYTTTLVAQDQTGLNQPVFYALFSGSLPSGLTLSNSGVISGTLSTVINTVTSTFVVAASTVGGTTNKGFNLSVSPYISPTWNTASGSLGTVVGGHAFNVTVGAIDNENLALTYAVTVGTLPPGLTLSNTTISGIATNPTSNDTNYNFSIAASDTYGSNTQSFAILVRYNAAPVFQNSGSLLKIYGGNTITTNVSVYAIDINNQTVSYALANGTSLPTNFLFSNTTGSITGAATNPASNTVTNFVVSATNGYTTSYQNYSIEVDKTLAPVFISNAGTLATYASNATVSTTILATDPQGFPITYSTVSGTLPTGLTLNANGVVSGTTPFLTSNTTSSFVVQATNGVAAASRTFSITVNAVPVPVWVTSGNLGNTLGGYPFSNTIVATDAGYTISYAVTTGSLPGNLVLNANTGVISGTVINSNTVQNATSFSVTASDGYNNAVQAFSIQVIYDTPPFINTVSGSLANVYSGQPINVSINAYDPTGYNQTLIYSLASGSLPSGVTLSTTGLISGTPIVSNTTTNSFSVQVTNGITSNTQNYSITINAAFAPTWNTSGSLGNVYQSTIFTSTLSATDNNGLSLTYAVTSGSLPTGLALSSSGVITGTVSNTANVGVDSFVVTASDSISNAAQSLSINVLSYVAPTWVTPSGILISGGSNTIVNTTVVATSAESFPITYSITSGTLPNGVSLSSSGVLSGTLPASGNTYSFAIGANDGVSTVNQSFSIIVYASAPVWTTTSLPIIYGLTPYSTTLVASNYPTYSIVSGTLPSGITLNATTGVISGIANNTQTVLQYNVTISASNSYGSVNQAFTLIVSQNQANYDPYSDAVIALLPLTGTVGATSGNAFVDNIGHTVNVVGSPSVVVGSTYNGLNQSAALYFPANSYLSIPLAEEAIFNTNDFTIEWSLFGNQSVNAINLSDNASGANAVLSISNGNVSTALFGSTTQNNVLSYTMPSLTNSWFNYALVKHGNTLALYINGNLVTTVTNNFAASLATPTYLVIGAQNGTAITVQNVRITNGAARYNGNYTIGSFPTLPSFVAAENTLLGVFTTNVPIANTTIAGIDPSGYGLTYNADLPTGLSINSSGVISGMPLGYSSDTTEIICNVIITDAYYNKQTRGFLISVLAPPVADTQGGSTVMLMHFDGVNNSTSFVEATGHIVTTGVGQPVLTTANPAYVGAPFGGSSLYLDGVSGLNIAPNGSEFNLQTNDFTVEASFMATSFNSLNEMISQRNPAGIGWWFGTTSNTSICFSYSSDNGNVNYINFATSFNTNTWYKIAVVRSGGTVTAYVNGVQVGSTYAIPYIYPNTGNLTIGYDSRGTTNYFAGYLDEIRLTNGYARYVANYNVATSEFANPIYWANTVYSGLNGSAVSLNMTPIEPYGAGFTALSLTGLPSGLTATNGIVTGTLASVSLDTSYSITATAASTYSSSTRTFTLKNYATPSVDRYVNLVTAQLSFGPVTNATAGYYDQVGTNAITPIGNTTTVTSPNLYGGSSLSLANTGSNYLSLSGGNYNLGANDFTIELATYFTVIQSCALIGYFPSVGKSFYVSYSGSTLSLIYINGASNVITISASGFTPSVNTWYNLALSRVGNTLYFFNNGSLISSSSMTLAVSVNPTALHIGSPDSAGTGYFKGYMQAIRLTIGVGRYTTNYSTAEFPAPVTWITPSGNLTTVTGGKNL